MIPKQKKLARICIIAIAALLLQSLTAAYAGGHGRGPDKGRDPSVGIDRDPDPGRDRDVGIDRDPDPGRDRGPGRR